MLRTTVVLAAVVLTAAAHAPARGQEPITPQDLLDASARSPDHRIEYGSDPLQFGHLYLPAGPGPHPVLAFIHGGCFLSQFDIAHTAPLSAAIADEGYAVWSIEYRRVGDAGGGWPATFRDVGRGLDHLGEIAGERDLDLGRVLVGGHSAGGAPVQVPERYAAASPMRLVPLEVPVTFVVGTLDTWTPPAMSWVYRARAVGTEELEVIELPESAHFEMIAPWSSSWPTVLDALRRAFDGIER